ncbi:MAG: carbamoyl-phosphate synthase small subunit [Chloroflexi bacterium]|jgi:carbamoyl-phosphate synthase small subunit|nr:MAG: carbamoyl-phosphate synthase small subunit [Chloroflexota bacterium]
MSSASILVLEDGSVYQGESMGTEGTAVGEVVFNTSMTGYQEILTDPSYAGQIVVATYPLIGNYGCNEINVESERIQVAGYVVRQSCQYPSHHLSDVGLNEYLGKQGVKGISEVDTRSVTRRIRSQGAMMGCITSELSGDQALEHLRSAKRYVDLDHVASVTTQQTYDWGLNPEDTNGGLHIVVADCGVKYNILRSLEIRGCRVTVVPATSSFQTIMDLDPSGVVFSPGPGDPALLGYAIDALKEMIGKVPLMGICLGHQLIARALGANTYKLKFGHHGGNHPVKDFSTGRTYITSQNHGFAVDGDTLPSGLEVSHVNLNDGTVEGIRHNDFPLMGIQFHSEAAPGPWDNDYLFDSFLSLVKGVNK